MEKKAIKFEHQPRNDGHSKEGPVVYVFKKFVLKYPPKIMLGIMEAPNHEKFGLKYLVCNLQTKTSTNATFGNLIFSHHNFAECCRETHFNIRKKPKKFHIVILEIGYLTNRSLRLP